MTHRLLRAFLIGLLSLGALPALAQTVTTNVTLTWIPPTACEDAAVPFSYCPVTSYKLYRRTAAGANEFITSFPAGSSGSARLPPGTHNVFLRSLSGTSESAGMSNIVAVTIVADKPSAPTNVQATVKFTVSAP